MEFRKIEVVPISGNIGALINGAQINALNDETFEEVYQAWLDPVSYTHLRAHET